MKNEINKSLLEVHSSKLPSCYGGIIIPATSLFEAVDKLKRARIRKEKTVGREKIMIGATVYRKKKYGAKTYIFETGVQSIVETAMTRLGYGCGEYFLSYFYTNGPHADMNYRENKDDKGISRTFSVAEASGLKRLKKRISCQSCRVN